MDVSASVKVRVIEGRDLKAFSSDGTSNPVTIVKFNGQSPNTTHKIKQTIKPVWDCTYVYPVNNPLNDTLTFELWDKHLLRSDNSMGNCAVPLTGLVKGLERVQWVPIANGDGDLRVGLTAVGFDTSQLDHPSQVREAEVGLQDLTQVKESETAQNWTVQDPEKYYAKSRFSTNTGCIQIFLNKPYYIEGEQIMGKVELTLNCPVQTNGIYLKFGGKEKVKTYREECREIRHESQGENRNEPARREYHYSIRDHTEKVQYLSGIVPLQVAGYLQPGRYVYQLPMIQLPSKCPGVFFDRLGKAQKSRQMAYTNDFGYGGIKYFVKAKVESTNIKVKESLVMSERLTQRVLPIAETKMKSFMFKSGQMRITAEVGKNVFCPGETLPIRMRINNPTSKDITAIKIKLWRTEELVTRLNKVKETKEICRQQYPGLPGSQDMDQVCPFVVPKDIYPSTNGKHVTCSYKIDIEVDLPWATDVNVQSKIVIALLPAPDMNVMVHESYNDSWRQW